MQVIRRNVDAKVQPVEHHVEKLNRKGRCEFYLFVQLKSVVDVDLETRVEDEEDVVTFSKIDEDEDYVQRMKG